MQNWDYHFFSMRAHVFIFHSSHNSTFRITNIFNPVSHFHLRTFKWWQQRFTWVIPTDHFSMLWRFCFLQQAIWEHEEEARCNSGGIGRAWSARAHGTSLANGEQRGCETSGWCTVFILPVWLLDRKYFFPLCVNSSCSEGFYSHEFTYHVIWYCRRECRETSGTNGFVLKK